MAMHSNVTDRQAKYFESMRASLEAATGKTLAEWIEIARTCPETKHRARLKWFKETHGLLQNRASLVIDEAFGASMPWREAATQIDDVWSDPVARAVYEAIDVLAMKAPDAVRTARKSYTAWSRTFQFAAARPIKSGGVMLGLAVQPEIDPALEPSKNESWSERLKSRFRIETPAAADARLAALLSEAWEKS
ncbi:MAG TPA: DUF4287 domain-containing protein [Caulobacteraceae bacterium]|jgi:hypothetical protein